VSAIDFPGRTIWIVDADRGGGKRFVVVVQLVCDARALLLQQDTSI
jgi:hypothetical protein